MPRISGRIPGFNAGFAIEKDKSLQLRTLNEKVLVRLSMEVIPQAYTLPTQNELYISELTEESGCITDPELGEICP